MKKFIISLTIAATIVSVSPLRANAWFLIFDDIGSFFEEFRSAAGPFSPSDIAGLELWLKADALSLSDADPVATWTDSSGQGNDAAQGTSGLRPTYQTNELNGKPVIRFDGSDDRMVVTGSVTAQPLTYFAVGKMNNVATYFFDGVSGNRFALGDCLNVTCNAIGIYADSAVVEALSPVGSFYVYSGIGNGASSNIYEDGTLLVTGNPGSSGLDGGMTIGDRFGAPLFPLNGDIAEILVYSGALSTANREAVEDYLGAKYGITITH